MQKLETLVKQFKAILVHFDDPDCPYLPKDDKLDELVKSIPGLISITNEIEVDEKWIPVPEAYEEPSSERFILKFPRFSSPEQTAEYILYKTMLGILAVAYGACIVGNLEEHCTWDEETTTITFTIPYIHYGS